MNEAATRSIDLDLRGLKCPMPVLLTKRALTRARSGETLNVRCTDPLAAIDIPHMLTQTGDALLAQDIQSGVINFTIRKNP